MQNFISTDPFSLKNRSSVNSSIFSEADLIRRWLQIEGFDCFISGGLLRDHQCDKEVRDIDIFVHTKDKRAIDKLEIVLDGLGMSNITKHSKLASFEAGPLNSNLNYFEIHRVISGIYGKHEYEIICIDTKNPFLVLKSFPLSICKAFKMKESYYLHDEFKISVRFKAIVCSYDSGPLRWEYLKKIMNKYHDYTFFKSYRDLAILHAPAKLKSEMVADYSEEMAIDFLLDLMDNEHSRGLDLTTLGVTTL